MESTNSIEDMVNDSVMNIKKQILALVSQLKTFPTMSCISDFRTEGMLETSVGIELHHQYRDSESKGIGKGIYIILSPGGIYRFDEECVHYNPEHTPTAANVPVLSTKREVLRDYMEYGQIAEQAIKKLLIT